MATTEANNTDLTRAEILYTLRGEIDATGPRLENCGQHTAERVFWVPTESRWTDLQNQAAHPDIATRIDDAILAVERDNPHFGGQPADCFLRNPHPDLNANHARAQPINSTDGQRSL